MVSVSVLDPVWALVSLLHFVGPLLSTPVIQQGMPLGEMIRYSEAARYDAEALRLQHHRLRRSPQDQQQHAGRPQHLTLNFTAHNRDFRLLLRPDNSIFADDVTFEGSSGPLQFDTGRAFAGTLEGEDDAQVHGLVTAEGLFDGTISTRSEHYYVEPASRYLREAPFHSVIYRSSDVVRPGRGSEPCASQRLHERVTGQHERVKRWWVPSAPSRTPSRTPSAAPRHRHSKAAPQPPEPPDLEYSDADPDGDPDGGGLRTLDHSEESFSDLSAHSPARPPQPPGQGPTSVRTLDYVVTNIREASSLEDFSEPYNTYQLNKHHNKGVDSTDNSVLQRSGKDESTGRASEANSALPENTNKIVLYNHTILIRPKTTGEDTGEGAGSNHLEKAGVDRGGERGGGGPEVVPYSKVLSGYYVPEDDPRHFNKRATIDPKKTTCMLYLQADHLFYQKYGTEEACIEVMTRHVQRVNAIYRTTDFNQDGKADNITFMIKRIKVHSTEALNDPAYRFPDNYGVEKFLELFSEEDYDAFCLAYMFTYRDFEMGTLGLAWTGDLKNAGGVCEKNGHYRGSLKSLNTGIVTLLNYGKHVPPAVSHVTLAHEIGHNFGSPHDPELCTPGGEDGNFIMFARATSGDKKNNNHFSPCSLNSINPVLNAKARSSKGCFTEPQTALCGNGVVEPGEECDCGWEEDCRDKCCYPQRRYPPPGEPPCRLTPRSLCSPSQGPCCTQDCSLRFGDKCRDDNGCRDSSFCDGQGPHCPPSINKPNKTICNEEFVCFMGECTGSICLAYGLESCQCIPGPNDPPTKACELCCKQPGDNNPCLSSFLWNAAPYDVPDMFSKPGTPCNDYNGYCDVFQKCREVDPSGPLATLRKLLLSEESIASFKRWVADNWYFVLLIAVVALVLLVMSAKYLAKRPDPKLLSVTIIHSSTTETVRLPGEGAAGGGGRGAGRGLQPTIVHPAASRKLPLKRRVRLDRRRRKDARNKTAPAPTPGSATAAIISTTAAATAAVPTPSAPPLSSAVSANSSATGNAAKANGSDAAAVALSLAAAAGRGKKKAPPALKKATSSEAESKAVPTEQQPHSPRKSARKSGPSTKLNIKKATKRSSKKKEVIDYSAKQSPCDQDKVLANSGGTSPLALTPSDDPMGKVHNWLLNSQDPAREPLCDAPAAASVPKSNSSPAGLTEAPAKTPALGAAQHRRSLVQPTGQLDADKVRLQVLYKTPFKFRLKFKGSGASGVTTKLSADRVRKQREVREPERDDPTSGKKVLGALGGIAGPRTAVLVRTREAGSGSGTNQHRKSRRKDTCDATAPPTPPAPVLPANPVQECPPTPPREADIDSNIHTVPSDLEGLLAEVDTKATTKRA